MLQALGVTANAAGTAATPAQPAQAGQGAQLEASLAQLQASNEVCLQAGLALAG